MRALYSVALLCIVAVSLWAQEESLEVLTTSQGSQEIVVEDSSPIDTIKIHDTVYIQIVPSPAEVAQKQYTHDSLLAEEFVAPVEQHYLAQNSAETVEKKRGYVGTSFSFSRSDGENYEIYGLFPVDQKKSNSFSIHLLGGYMVRDRFGVGAGLAYTYKKISFEANDTVDVNSIKIGYTIVPHIRNYIPLPRESFFQIFNQTNLGFSFLSGLEEDDNGTSIDRWSTDEFEFRLGIQPGISVFAGKGVTIEASIDVLGFTMTRTRIEHNGEFYGYHNTADLSFTLSLYTLALGITVYI